MTDRPEAMIINSLVRQALTSAQEVMGDNGLNTVLKNLWPGSFHRQLSAE